MIALLLHTALLATPAPALIPFDFETNQIFVRASVNGAEPGWFVLDTGASGNVLDTALTKKLGIKPEAERQTSGAGKGTVKTGIARGVRYDVGGTSTVAETTYLIDLSGQPALVGREVAGILGYDFFTKFAVEIDYEAQVLRLHDPATFKPPPGAEALPFTLDKKTPHVPIQIKVPGQVAVTKTVLVEPTAAATEERNDWQDSQAGA
ncbi:MAG TPA: retropepsin-like aspartic protease [Myxococcaceae bacterium]|nr:retropepsin-like aspartic protease [Myxococcaceae bacterium]